VVAELWYDSSAMARLSSIAHRRPKAEKPSKLVVYLTRHENDIVEKAAAASGRSKSAFGADVILVEAHRILGLPHKK
jgi:uncharacterized protein (DUF1778 family)